MKLRKMQRDPDLAMEIKFKDLELEKIINLYRIVLVANIALILNLFIYFTNGLSLNFFVYELPVLIVVFYSLYKLHHAIQRKVYRLYLKYVTVTTDYIITTVFLIKSSVLFIDHFGVETSQYLLFISIFYILLNSISALRVQKQVIIYSAVFGILINTVVHLYFGGHLFNIFYTNTIILFSGLLNSFIARFIYLSFVSSYKQSKTLVKLEKANEIILSSYEEINTQNEELEAQNESIVRQNKEIFFQKKQLTSSINYASNIQSAILSNENEIIETASNSFIIYKPKYIVSGDFYWFKKVDVFTKTYNVFTAVDCTGHGVPGAFMSMLGISLLNDVITGFYDELDVAEVLNRLREEVKVYLHQENSDVLIKDGMDMALCAIDYDDMVLQYAGANNPLYIIRSEDQGYAKEIEIYKPNKYPIGVHPKDNLPFTKHEIKINNGDLIYVFSDGYYDQFGGVKGEKFLKRRFRDLLLSISHLPMQEQKRELELQLEQWMGDKNPQVDDITIIGVKVSV